MKIKNLLGKLSLIGLIAYAVVSPITALAAGQITNRSVTLSTSAGGAASSYTATFTLATSGQSLGSVKLEICDSPLSTVSCVNTGNSNGATFTGATLGSVTCAACNGGAWSLGSASGNTAYVTHTAAAVTGTPTVTVVFNGVTNPSANNKEFFVKISTFATIDTTGANTDFGGVALSTAQQITVSGTMPESLVFCVGTSGTDCTNMTGSSVNLGTFSPTGTSTGTSLMDASTNASSGYVITVNGATLTSGANTIAACASNCASTTGTGQFGTNEMANTTPSVGANVTPTGAGFNGAAATNYSTANSFRYVSGDVVASSSSVTNAQLFTNSYIVNVGGSQAAGVYTATMTYICMATF